jgi:hypothetical protein
LIEAVAVQLCMVDNKPIDVSEAYFWIAKVTDKETADKLTYWHDVPLRKEPAE